MLQETYFPLKCTLCTHIIHILRKYFECNIMYIFRVLYIIYRVLLQKQNILGQKQKFQNSSKSQFENFWKILENFENFKICA